MWKKRYVEKENVCENMRSVEYVKCGICEVWNM